MIKVVKLRELSELKDINNLYFQEFICRHDNDIKLEFTFDYDGLNQAEIKGWSCHISQLQTRLFREYKNITKYMKRIHEVSCIQYKHIYEFYTKEEYKKIKLKRNLKYAFQIISFLLLMSVAIYTKFKGVW